MPVPARALASSASLSAAAILATLLSTHARLVPVSDVTRRELEGPCADLYLPPRLPAPGLVLVLGALREGRRYEVLERAARAIAGCGFAVLVPELGRLRTLVLGSDALDDLVAATRALPRRDGVVDAPVGLIGFSLGGSLALLAAGDPRLAGRVACVAAMGAYFRLADMLAAATAGSLAGPSAYAVAASLAATLPADDRAVLQHAIDTSPDSPAEALSRIPPASIGPQAGIVVAAFRGRNPTAVLQDLAGIAAVMDALSPERSIGRVDVPTWLLHDERDRYVPATQLDAMRAAVAGRRNFRSFKLRLLEHTEPAAPALDPVRLFGDYAPGLVNLFRFVRGPLQVLRRAAARG